MKDLFWQKIIRAAAEEPYYFFESEAEERRICRMRKAISGLDLSDDSLIELYLLAVQSVDLLDNPNFHGACRLFWGGMSDDTFEDHRRWVVSLVFEHYRLAMNDTDAFYVSFIDLHPHPVSPFFESLFGPFTDEMYERKIDESGIEFAWERERVGEIPDAVLRERFPEIARRLDQHKCDDFDSLSDQANRTLVLIEQGKIK